VVSIAAPRLARGAFWFAFASGISKASSLLAQLVLGWFLVAEEFGLYAIAMSLSAIALAFRNGGADQYLVQQGQRYNELAPSVFLYALTMNIFGAGLLVLIGACASFYYGQAALWVMLVVVGLAQIVTSGSMVLRAQLSATGRYEALSGVVLASDLTRQGSLMLFAALGLGVYAFVIPMVLEPLVSIVLVLMLVTYRLSLPKFSWQTIRHFFDKCKWLMLSNLASALTMSALFFIASLYYPMAEVGILFFAMQLVTSLTVPITNSVNTIYFAHLANQVQSGMAQGFLLRGIVGLACIGLALTFLIWVGGDVVVSFLWQGRWDDAIPLLEIYAFAVPAILFSSLATASLSAEGKWRSRFNLLAILVAFDLLVFSVAAEGFDGTISDALLATVVVKGVLSLPVLIWLVISQRGQANV
jgi:O-antigen/teichoic acid export membrane protein